MIDPKNLREVIHVLKEYGVTYFKSDEMELKLDVTAQEDGKIPFPLAQSTSVPIKKDEDPEIKHKVDELTSLLRLGDEDLVDRLFPDYTKEEV